MRLGRRLLIRASVGLVLIALLLVAGQVGQLAPVLRQAGAIDWTTLLLTAAGILVEPALPIVCLFACATTYGALRAEGSWIAAEAAGHRPARLLLPALGLGIGAATLAAALAHGPVPRWIQQVRGTVVAGLNALPADTDLRLAGGRARVAADGSLHAVWDQTYLQARSARLVKAADTWHLVADDAWIWAPGARIEVRSAQVALDRRAIRRRLGQLGPPNSLATAQLDTSPRHRFLAARRTALPCLAVGWALLGGLIGIRVGPLRAVAAAAGLVALSYWVLRMGELNARAGMMSPLLAAWAPVGLNGLLAVGGLLRSRRGG